MDNDINEINVACDNLTVKDYKFKKSINKYSVFMELPALSCATNGPTSLGCILALSLRSAPAISVALALIVFSEYFLKCLHVFCLVMYHNLCILNRTSFWTPPIVKSAVSNCNVSNGHSRFNCRSYPKNRPCVRNSSSYVKLVIELSSLGNTTIHQALALFGDIFVRYGN